MRRALIACLMALGIVAVVGATVATASCTPPGPSSTSYIVAGQPLYGGVSGTNGHVGAQGGLGYVEVKGGSGGVVVHGKYSGGATPHAQVGVEGTSPKTCAG